MLVWNDDIIDGESCSKEDAHDKGIIMADDSGMEGCMIMHSMPQYPPPEVLVESTGAKLSADALLSKVRSLLLVGLHAQPNFSSRMCNSTRVRRPLCQNLQQSTVRVVLQKQL